MYGCRAILVEHAPGEHDHRNIPGSRVFLQALDQLDSGLAAIEEHLGDDDLRHLLRGHAKCVRGVLCLQRGVSVAAQIFRVHLAFIRAAIDKQDGARSRDHRQDSPTVLRAVEHNGRFTVCANQSRGSPPLLIAQCLPGALCAPRRLSRHLRMSSRRAEARCGPGPANRLRGAKPGCRVVGLDDYTVGLAGAQGVLPVRGGVRTGFRPRVGRLVTS